MTNKLKLHSPDFTQANIAKLAELFPNCVTETRETDGLRPLLTGRKSVISLTGRASAKPC
jgi:hypothetical protein